MFQRFTTSAVVAGLVFLGAAFPAEASSITCPTTGTFDRQGSVTNALTCVALDSQTGTPKLDDVGTVFGGSWTGAGSLTGSDGTDGWLTASVTSGSWGSLPVTGSLAIDQDLWTAYSRAAITFHLGNGGGSPDWLFFEMSPGTISSSFELLRLSGTGGGLSNIVLWVSLPTGTLAPSPLVTPEPQSLILMGSGLLGLAAFLRRRRRT